jgi:hypothetical protein
MGEHGFCCNALACKDIDRKERFFSFTIQKNYRTDSLPYIMLTHLSLYQAKITGGTACVDYLSAKTCCPKQFVQSRMRSNNEIDIL